MNASRTVIAIDGLAGSGKTTLSRLLAEKLGFVHLSTGMLYRTVGYLSLKEGVSPEDEKAVVALIHQYKPSLELDEKRRAIVRVGANVLSKELYSTEVSEITSKVSTLRGVREALHDAQRHAFEGEGLIAEGRDMGTVIFPDADVKLFVECSVETRVSRRLSQIQEKKTLSEEEISQLTSDMQKEIVERDERDKTREIAPAVAASDAITIDNSGPPLTLVLQTMYDAVASRGLLSDS